MNRILGNILTEGACSVNIVVVLTIKQGGEPITAFKDRALGYQIRTLTNQVMHHTEKVLSQLSAQNITPIQGWIGRYLENHRGEDVFQKDIEENLDMSSPTASRVLQLMEKNGFIVRESVAEDKRYKKILPTPLLMEISQQVKEELFNLEREMKKGIDSKEMAAFVATMEKIQKNLDQLDRSDVLD